MTESVDCAVIGAGVVGLAVARALARRGREVVVLEAAGAIGTAISSRSSDVVHAGLYYPAGSLKARLCVAGKALLYDFCAAFGVAHRRCGKLLVATEPARVPDLRALRAGAAANGVDDLRWLDREALAECEPALTAEAALLSPSTGLIDSHGLMLALQGDAEAHGALVALRSLVAGGRVDEAGARLRIGGTEPMELACRHVVNAAGLGAQAVSASLAGVPAATIPPRHLAKGNYFALTGRCPFSRPVYPLPEAAGLGVHLTLDLGGQARFGPDVEWVESEDYTVDPARAEAFYEAIRRYWPGLPDGSLRPDYAGIRPKVQAPGEPAADFVVRRTGALVALYGIESPGLTACLALAEMVAGRLD